ncbi:MAG: cobalt ECF transporter T component CbiQ [Merismopedia sp. SIO2A8]|nr:cobalt ECF transporter T component CbiQ [Merismopedia sp. SIO2A8]
MNIRSNDCTHLNSWVHQWDARFKVIGLVGLMMAFATIRSISLLPWMVLIVTILYRSSRLPLSFLARRLSYPGFFLAGIVLFIPWVSGHTPLWQWGPLTLWKEGSLSALLIAGRFLCSVTVGFIILGTTPFLTLVNALRSLGLPAVLTDMMLLAYRYLFEISDNFSRMRRAMALRGFQSVAHRYRSASQLQPRTPHPARKRVAAKPQNQINTIAMVTGTLFIRSYEQAERVYQAMRLRGYGYSTQRLTPFRHDCPHRTTEGHGWDAIALLAIIIVVALLLVGNYHLVA